MPIERDAGDKKRIHIWLFEDDVNRLDAMVPNTRIRSKILRNIVHKWLNAVEARAQEDIDRKNLTPITISLEMPQ